MTAVSLKQQESKLKLLPTQCENNFLVLACSENPMDFPLVRSVLSKLVAYTRNFPYT